MCDKLTYIILCVSVSRCEYQIIFVHCHPLFWWSLHVLNEHVFMTSCNCRREGRRWRDASLGCLVVAVQSCQCRAIPAWRAETTFLLWILCLTPNKCSVNPWELDQWLVSIDCTLQKYKETYKQPQFPPIENWYNNRNHCLSLYPKVE